MSRVSNAPAGGGRVLIDSLESEFAQLHSRSCRILQVTPPTLLYANTRQKHLSPGGCSVGESLVRAAGIVEQTFGGLTASLWDDPFDWTLPETLSTASRVLEYLDEVETTRKRAFSALITDADLVKEISLPVGNIEPLVQLLLTTLVRAAEYQGQALAVLKSLSPPSATGFII